MKTSPLTQAAPIVIHHDLLATMARMSSPKIFLMRRILLMTAVLLVGLAIGGYVFFNGERKVPVRYRTAMIERGPVISVVTATGSVNPVYPCKSAHRCRE